MSARHVQLNRIRQTWFTIFCLAGLLAITGCRSPDNTLLKATKQGDLNAVRMALEKGANVNAKGKQRFLEGMSSRTSTEFGGAASFKIYYTGTPLMNATSSGHISIITLLLEHGADVNGQNEYGTTALMVATNKANMEVVMMLLQHHADPNKSDQKGITALMLAAFHGHTEIVKMLLEHGANVNQENQKGGTALAFAVNQKKKNLVKLLLEHGAQGGKSIRQKVFDRILAWETPELSKLLLESIATTEIAVFDTHEKLTEAVHSGTIKIARLWIEQGADVNTTDEEQRTLLMDAAFRGNAEMVTLLLEQGADVRTATPSGWTAFDVADAAGYSDVVQLLIQAGAISEKAYAATKDLVQAARHGDLETARNALNNGANANARVFEDHLKGLTVLMMTAYYGHTQILELLLKHGAHVHATDDLPYKGGGFYVGRARGYTSLHFAVDRGHFEAADLLLKHGADINARGPLSLTSLIDASEKGNIEAVKFLIDRGADLTITVEVDFGSFNGLTALQIAEKQEHSEIVRLLKEAGAQ